MNRRGFLQNAMLAAAALVVDPEKLLWTPGQKRIFIPKSPAAISVWTYYHYDIPSGVWQKLGGPSEELSWGSFEVAVPMNAIEEWERTGMTPWAASKFENVDEHGRSLTGIKTRVALYARVSTKQHGQDPETQLLPLRDRAQYHNFVISAEYVDVGISGSKQRRPQLDRMMHDAKLGKFDAVMVWKFDRFARSTTHLLTALEQFREWSIDFISLSEAIDTTTPIGKMIFTVLGAVAELERSLIRERVQAGVDRAKKEGKRLGRPRALVDEEKVYEQLQSGVSLRSLAIQTGVARGTLQNIKRRWDAKKGLDEAVKSGARD